MRKNATTRSKRGYIHLIFPIFLGIGLISLTAAGGLTASSSKWIPEPPSALSPPELIPPSPSQPETRGIVLEEREIAEAVIEIREEPEELPSEIPVSGPAPREVTLENEDGSWSVTNYNSLNLRTQRHLFDSQDRLLERWVFDPSENGRIVRYEIYTYQKKGLKSYRIAEWEYEPSGAFLKTNRIYNTKAEKTAAFLEFTDADGIKLREEWFNRKEQPIAVKSWHAGTGDFRSHVLIEPFLKKWQRLHWLDENGNRTHKEVIFSSGESSFWSRLLSRIRLGRAYDTEGYRNIQRRDRDLRRALPMLL